MLLRRVFSTSVVILSLGLAACAGMGSSSVSRSLTLSGAQEVPPVETPASGSGTITIGADGAVSGSITTQNITSTVAHIHVGAAGTNGPVIVPFVKNGETYTAPPGAKLTEAQMASYKAGNLYFNVHSAKHPGGEIRAQLRP
jgi:hypothetical protein